MATKLYLRNTVAPSSPTAGEQSTSMTPTVGSTTGAEDRALALTQGTAQTSHSVTFAGIANVTAYFGRWSSAPLDTQTIPAQTWTIAVGASRNANAGCQLRVVIYVWRPSTSAKVGTIYDSATNWDVAWDIDTEEGRVASPVGAALAVTAGDILVLEVWGFGAQNNAGLRGRSLYFDGTTDPTSGTATSDAASYIESPGTLTFTVVPTTAYRDVATRLRMVAAQIRDLATRLRVVVAVPSTASQATFYFRDVASPDAPTLGTKSSAYAPNIPNPGDTYQNRSLLPDKGTAQTYRSVSLTGTGTKDAYIARFTSLPLTAQQVNAGTWTAGVAASAGSSTNAQWGNPVIYLWRPSTQTVVQMIRDQRSSLTGLSTVERGYVRNMTLVPAVAIEDGDVLVVEFYEYGFQSTNGTRAYTFYFDGTTDVVDASTPTNAASWITLPQSLSYSTRGADVRTRLTAIIGGARNVTTRMLLAVTTDIRTRVSVVSAGAFRDVRTLVWIRAPGATDIRTRVHIRFARIRDTRTRVTVIRPNLLRDVTTRVVARPLAYRDTSTRLTVGQWRYWDVLLRLVLVLEDALLDVATRCVLAEAIYPDVTTRVVMEAVSYAGLSRIAPDLTQPEGTRQIWFRGSF